MSVVRRTGDRAQSRKAHSSPYARPQTSGWSLRKLFEPIRRRVFGQHEEDEDSFSRPHKFAKSPTPEELTDTEEGEQQVHTLGTLASIGTQATEPPRSTTTSPKRRVPSPGLNATETVEKVIDFLNEVKGTRLQQDEARHMGNLIQQAIPGEKLVSQALFHSAGRIFSVLEAEGSISMLRRSMAPPRQEPFRFQSTPSSRDASPAPPPSNGNTPRKTLKRNPNGSYRWEGAGSARQSRRNRFGSPALAAPHITPEKPKADGKRRKIDENNSPPPSNGLQPTPTPPYSIAGPQASRTNGPITPKLNITTQSPSRLRTPVVVKPTTPSQPSPLRQAWQLSPTGSHENLEQSSPPPAPQPSETANLMSQLIKQATPPKRPDLSNPYQTASPIAKVGPPRRSTRRSKASARPDQANGKESEEKQQAEQLKDIPAQAIIEATVPKGSKRSRPPTDMEKSSSPEASGSSQSSNASFPSDDVDMSESDRFSKKAKGVSFSTPETGLKDVQMSNGTSADKPSASSGLGISGTSAARSAFNSLKSTTAPSRPSNLRFSYQPEGSSAPPSPTNEEKASPSNDAEMSAPPPPTTTSTFGNLPSAAASSSKLQGAPPVAEKSEDVKMDVPESEKLDPKAQALKTNKSKLPTFTFTMSVRASDTFSKVQNEVKSMSASSLPTFNFTLSPAPSSSSSSPSPSSASSASAWTCSLCMLKNPDSAKHKCVICDADRPSATTTPAPPPAVKAFDWSAAGMAAPSTSSGKSWTCSTCMLSNPASATEQCTVCEADRPGATNKALSSSAPAPAPAAPAVKAFDWSAAGIAPPAPPSDKWTCGTCMCSNPKDAAKCVVCETPR